VSRLYLLDTNILSDLVRNPKGRIRDEIARVGAKSVATSIVVAAELRYGATKRNSPRLSAQVKTILASIDILPLEPPADEIYGFIRADLERRGVSMGQYDLLIAAQALASNLTLVTDNEREFSRVAGLGVENWLR
jgi:tRNA(fMet)-specific endonuclease VapC